MTQRIPFGIFLYPRPGILHQWDPHDWAARKPAPKCLVLDQDSFSGGLLFGVFGSPAPPKRNAAARLSFLVQPFVVLIPHPAVLEQWTPGSHTLLFWSSGPQDPTPCCSGAVDPRIPHPAVLEQWTPGSHTLLFWSGGPQDPTPCCHRTMDFKMPHPVVLEQWTPGSHTLPPLGGAPSSLLFARLFPLQNFL